MDNDIRMPGSQPREDSLEESESALERPARRPFGLEGSAEEAQAPLGEGTRRKLGGDVAYNDDALRQRDATIAELRRRIAELEEHLETFATLLHAGRSRKRATDRSRDPKQLLSELAERLTGFEKVRQQQQGTIDQLSHTLAMQQVDHTFDQAQSQRNIFDRVGDSLRHAQVYGEPLFCVMVGLDQPQKLRAEHGAANYGYFLVQIAQRLKYTLRRNDQLMRYDDEAFLLIPEANRLDQVRGLGERLVKTICRERLRMGAQEIKPSISISMLQYQPEIGGANELIRLARRILVEAQTRGQKQVAVYPQSVQSADQ